MAGVFSGFSLYSYNKAVVQGTQKITAFARDEYLGFTLDTNRDIMLPVETADLNLGIGFYLLAERCVYLRIGNKSLF